MTRIFYLGAMSHVLSPQHNPDRELIGAPRYLPRNSPIETLLTATGTNTGNLLIGHAINRHLKAEAVGHGIKKDSKYIEENFDHIVIGASNFLYRGFDFEAFADFLERVKLPCAIIGLGAQEANYEDRHVSLSKGTERMLRIISERSTSLGVRGFFTASILIDHGITNVRVIGCPSMYWTCQPSMKIVRGAYKKDFKVAVNGSANYKFESGKIMEGQLARLSYEKDYPYILQNEILLMKIISNEENDLDGKAISSLKTMYGLSELSTETFIHFVKTRMKTFFDIEEWMAEMKGFEFVIGTRFHGCLIPLLGGVPSFVFYHDTRTREMCELLHIPHEDIRKVQKIDLQALYESADFTALEISHKYLYQNYIGFLEENGLEHNLSRLVAVA